jgi:hypothetical protein
MDYIIYISGKVTGENWEQCRQKFQKIEDKLRSIGVKHIVNPMKLGLTEDTPRKYAMKICLKALEKCSAIFLLSDWTESKGANEEFEAAALQAKEVFFEDMNDFKAIELLMSKGYITV